MGQAAFLVVFLLALYRIVYSASVGRLSSASVTAVALFTWSLCLLLAAHLQEADQVSSKLSRAGLLAAPTSQEIDRLAVGWAVELLIVVTAEIIVARSRWKIFGEGQAEYGEFVNRGTGLDRVMLLAGHRWRHAPHVVAFLLLSGLLAFAAFPPGPVADRADAGQGVATVLRGLLICGLAMLVYFRAFNRRWPWLIVIVGVAYLSYLNVRSPLVVIFLAFFASEINSGNLRSKRRVASIALISLVLAFVGSLMSDLRANDARSLGLTTGQVIERNLQNPLVAPFRTGVDTLDGYRLSMYVAPQERPHPEALLTTFAYFVPRALWPEKPRSLTEEISDKYLNYKQSGQFLSPTGLLTLIAGSYVGGLLLLFLFSMAACASARLASGTPWLVIVLVIVFRFFLGGSEFDVYYGFTFAIPILLVRSVVNFQDSLAARVYGGASSSSRARF